MALLKKNTPNLEPLCKKVHTDDYYTIVNTLKAKRLSPISDKDRNSETKLEKIKKRFYRIRTQILVSALYEMSDAHWGLRKYADALKEQDSLYAEIFNELLAEKLEDIR